MKLEDVILYDDRASQPAANSVPIGTIYYVTDESVTERSNGTTWDDISDAGTVANDSITDAKLRNSGALSVIGRAANSTGDPADISAVAASGAVLRESGSTLGFGTIVAAGIASDAVTTAKILDGNVTYAKIQDISATDRLLGRDTAGAGDTEEIAVSSGLEFTGGPGLRVTAAARTRTLGITIDGGGSAITTGVKGYISFPVAGTITAVRMLADQSGSAVVDVWKDTYANYPPTDADSITAAAVPTITTATKSEDTTLTGWTTSVSAGDVFGFNVDSASTITRLHVTLTIVVTG